MGLALCSTYIGHRKRARRIRNLINVARGCIIEVGRELIEAKAEVAHRIAANEIYPEAYETLKAYIGRIHPADEPRALLMLDQWFNGDLTPEAWHEARMALGLIPPRQSPASTPTSTAASEPQVSMVELWPTRGSKS